MAILTSKGAKAPHQLKGRRNVRITRDRRGSGSDFVGVSYDSKNKKIQQTIGGETSDVVTVATLKDAMNLPADVADVVQDKNMKAVSSNAVNSALSNYFAKSEATIPDGGSLRKRNGIVYLSSTAWISSSSVIPEGFRPSLGTYVTCFNSNGEPLNIIIGEDGQISRYSGAQLTEDILINATWFTE